MRRVLSILAAAIISLTASAQSFDTTFEDATLRLDYTFMGNAQEQHVAIAELSSTPNWWGRRINLDNVPLKGNGDLTLYDAATNEVIYKTSFSSLFQEWITTPEALSVTALVYICVWQWLDVAIVANKDIARVDGKGVDALFVGVVAKHKLGYSIVLGHRSKDGKLKALCDTQEIGRAHV